MNQQPNSNADAGALEDWESRIMDFEERLRPIARSPVDITRPGWLDRLRAGVPPLDQAGVREHAEQLLGELIAAYAKGGDETRSALRRMFAEYRSFAWAAALSTPRTSVEGLKQHLILFAMKDQGRDSRDALLTMQELFGRRIRRVWIRQRRCERLLSCPAAQTDTAWVQHATCC